jgi:antitoxin component YwqK of YwqJK toxin-antitoxin module
LSNTEIESHCNCKDLKMKASSDKLTKNYLNTILFSGSCEDYYPNSDQIYLEANYKKGLLHGFTIHYTKNGSAILMQKYEEGILIEEIIPQ